MLVFLGMIALNWTALTRAFVRPSIRHALASLAGRVATLAKGNTSLHTAAAASFPGPS